MSVDESALAIDRSRIRRVAGSVAAPVIVGIAFGIYPALRAARLSPIEAIRPE